MLAAVTMYLGESMNHLGAVSIVAAALAAVGCYETHGLPHDGTIDGGATDRDGRIDVGLPDGDGAPLDGGARDGSAVDAGLDLRECPPPGIRECYCWIENVEEDEHGRCITPYGAGISDCDVGLGCSQPGWLCHDLAGGTDLGDSTYGICVPPQACEWLRSIDSRSICFYEDGTPYRTGVLASTECAAEDREVLCGPGCGGCADGRSCVGASERSGLGLCVAGSPPTSSSRCGEGFAACGPGEACVGFVLPSDVTTVRPEQVWHSCVPAAHCTRLATRHPDRFRCRG